VAAVVDVQEEIDDYLVPTMKSPEIDPLNSEVSNVSQYY
jgi:hypothetical protein